MRGFWISTIESVQAPLRIWSAIFSMFGLFNHLTMRNYENYALGSWIKGDGEGTTLFNAITAKEIGRASSKGLDFSEMMSYARKVGGTKLRKMTFQERGLMLKALALHLHSIKNKFYLNIG